MAVTERSKKRPAHELISVLIAKLDDTLDEVVALEGRMVLEVAIEKICQVIGMMVIPGQHLPILVSQLEVLGRDTNSPMVRQSLEDLISYLKEDV